MTDKENKKTKTKFFTMRFSDEDEEIINKLTKMYQIEKTTLIRYAMRHILETCPTFKVEPSHDR